MLACCQSISSRWSCPPPFRSAGSSAVASIGGSRRPLRPRCPAVSTRTAGLSCPLKPPATRELASSPSTPASSVKTGTLAQPLEAVRQPRVHFGDAGLQQGQGPVVGKQPGFDAGNVRGEALGVAQRDELVLPAVHWGGSRWRVALRLKEPPFPAALATGP